MKLMLVCLLSLLAACQSNAVTTTANVNPVSRVVDLLKSLSTQIEKEGKKEEDLYESFVCWGKSVIEQKTATNAAAQSRIDVLSTYVADLGSGRIELTSERDDLEKDVATIQSDMEKAKDMREKEHEDFKNAEDEMKTAITSLNSAIKVLGEATKTKKSLLIAVGQELKGGMESLTEHQAQLRNAVKYGDRFLNKADALFLRRLLLGDVPKVSWKKLNRKATFKMAYKARSSKIQDVLAKMQDTFTTNLKDATDKDNEAASQYKKMRGDNQDQLDTATTALGKMSKEGSAKAAAKEEATDEIDALKEQVANDTKFIENTKKELAKKKDEWQGRMKVRKSELAAISQAVNILHNDDARDLMKKSFSSQHFLFLQTGQAAHLKASRATEAAEALRDAARRSGDGRLMTLARGLSRAAPSVRLNFEPVIKAMDKMIQLIKSDENKDLDIKQSCEKDRMKDVQSAIMSGRTIDDHTATITRLSQEIDELAAEIKEAQADHAKATADLAKATQMRKNEHGEWLASDADDKKAAETVASAKKALEKFYKDKSLSLAQKMVKPAVVAGEAPPPPPSTWDGAYGGKTGESAGIMSLLDTVHDDITKDRALGKSEEEDAKEEFDEFKADTNKHQKALNALINKKQKEKGGKESERTKEKKARGLEKEELDGTFEKIESINPNCEYYEVNYPLRRKNRQIEMDGLLTAKAVMNGGEFAKKPDPNREIKPGDAFLQKRN